MADIGFDSFGQKAGSPFDFGKLFGSSGFGGLMKGVGAGGKLGLDIFNALGNRDFMKDQIGIQKDELGMKRDAFNRNKAREDLIANLDFTSGRQ